MNNIKMFKENIIRQYVSDVISDGYVDVKQMKRQLKDVLKEEPGIELKYLKDTILNEDTNTVSEVEKLHSISIYYTYEIEDNGNSIPYFDKCEYIID